MYMKRTSAQLKQAARGIMLGKYRNAISLILASDLILSTLSLFTTTAADSTLAILIGFLISLIITIFGTILSVGQCSFYLNIACEHPFEFLNLFTGFKIHPDKTIIARILIYIFTTLPIIPGIVVMYMSFSAYNIIITFLIGCFLLIIGCGISWWISLKYSQVYYLLLDFPDYSVGELLKMSWKLMKGNTGRLLYIQVSFIPLTLAGLLSFGIGLLLVKPYRDMTYTLFYLDLIQSEH